MNKHLTLAALVIAALGFAGTSSAGTLFWDGTDPKRWDDGGTPNWGIVSGGPYSQLWAPASDANFEGTAGVVNVYATINSVNSIKFDVDGYSLNDGDSTGTIRLTGTGGNITTGAGTDTINAIIAGTVGLTKLGAGTLILGGANTHTGATKISAGTLQLGNNLALQNSALDTSSAGTLAFSAGIDVPTFGGLTSGTNLTLASNVTALTLNLGTGVTRTYSGGLGSATAGMTLTKTGAGTQVLSGANTYTGATTISVGNLTFAKRAALYNDTAASWTPANIGVAASAILGIGVGDNASGYFDAADLDTLLNGTHLGLSTPTTGLNTGSILGVDTSGATAGAFTYNTAITDPGTALGLGLAKLGTGALTLGGANTYSGATNVSVGVLNIQNNTATGTTAAGTTVSSGAALQIQGGITVGAEALTLNGTGISTTGALRNISGANTYGGLVTLGSATRINSDAGSLTLSNTGIITGAAFGLTVGGAGNTTINSIIGTTTGTLTKDGAGTLTLSGANTFTGLITVSGGALKVDAGAGGSLNGNAMTLGSDTGGRGTFIYDNTTADGETAQSMGALTLSGSGDQTVQLTRTALQATSLTFSSVDSRTTFAAHQVVNFVIAGTPGVNGADSKIVLTGLPAGFGNGGGPPMRYFNGSNFAWYDAGGFVRGINYGIDAGTLTSAGGESFASGTHQEITGPITAQNTASLGSTGASGADGTLKINGAYDITMGAGNTLTITGPNGTSCGVLKSGGGTATVYGGFRVNVQGQGYIRTDAADDVLVIENGINNSAAGKTRLTKSGAGTLILKGANSWGWFGGFEDYIHGGTLELGGAGTILHSSKLIIASGALFRFNSSAAQSFTQVISGEGSLTVAGAGTLTLSAVNTYTGGTTVSGGTLALDYTAVTSRLADAGILTLAGGTVDLRNGASSHNEIIASTTLAGGRSNVTRSSGTSVLRMNTITPGVGFVNFGAASIAQTDNTITNGILGPWATMAGTDWAVNSTNAADGLITAYSSYTDIDAQAGGPGSSTIADDSTTNVRIYGDGTSGPITLGGLTTTTVNTLLQNNATYAATVATAGKTLATDGIMIGSGMEALTIGVNVGDGSLQAATAGANLVLNNNNAGKTLTINAPIVANSTSGLITAGNVLLNGANTYAGNTAISAGTLTLGAANAIPGGTGKGNVAVYGTLDLNGKSLIINGLSGSGAVDNISGADTYTLTAGANDQTSTFSGAIKNSSGTVALTKTGAGALILTGANAYTGATTISSGTLLVNWPGSLAAGSAVTVQGGGTLGGDGTINGAVTVDADGTLAPGASAGTLNVGTAAVPTSVTMAADSIYQWEFDGTTADSVDITGDLTLTTGWKLTLVDAGGTPKVGVQYDLFTYTGEFGVGGSIKADITRPVGWPHATIAQDAGRIYLSFTLLLPGDTNDDFVVDAADYITVKQNFGMTDATLGAEEGDFDDSGTVDWTDLQTLMANFGTRSVDEAPAAPEPATLGLLAIGALAVIHRRRA